MPSLRVQRRWYCVKNDGACFCVASHKRSMPRNAATREAVECGEFGVYVSRKEEKRRRSIAEQISEDLTSPIYRDSFPSQAYLPAPKTDYAIPAQLLGHAERNNPSHFALPEQAFRRTTRAGAERNAGNHLYRNACSRHRGRPRTARGARTRATALSGAFPVSGWWTNGYG